MASNEVRLRPTQTISAELDQLRQAISRRAYELFRSSANESPLDNWLAAERQLVWRPAVEVRLKNGVMELLAAVPGVSAGELQVHVAPEDVLIKANVHHEHTVEKGDVCLCEFVAGRLFRSVHLPQRIDTGSATANCDNGMLRLKARIAATAAGEKSGVRAA